MRDTGKGDVFIRVHALGVAVLPAGLVCHSVQDGAKLVVAEARILWGPRCQSYGTERNTLGILLTWEAT